MGQKTANRGLGALSAFALLKDLLWQVKAFVPSTSFQKTRAPSLSSFFPQRNTQSTDSSSSSKLKCSGFLIDSTAKCFQQTQIELITTTTTTKRHWANNDNKVKIKLKRTPCCFTGPVLSEYQFGLLVLSPATGEALYPTVPKSLFLGLA